MTEDKDKFIKSEQGICPNCNLNRGSTEWLNMCEMCIAEKARQDERNRIFKELEEWVKETQAMRAFIKRDLPEDQMPVVPLVILLKKLDELKQKLGGD